MSCSSQAYWVRLSFCREKAALGALTTRYIPFELQIADIFTKPIENLLFWSFRAKQGVHSIITSKVKCQLKNMSTKEWRWIQYSEWSQQGTKKRSLYMWKVRFCKTILSHWGIFSNFSLIVVGFSLPFNSQSLVHIKWYLVWKEGAWMKLLYVQICSQNVYTRKL